MKSLLPQLATDILAHPQWIARYAAPNAPNEERATIKHLHWSLAQILLPENNLFVHRPQHDTAMPHIIANIPWNNNHPQLLSYLRGINDDWRCIQLFLQALQLYTNIIPTHPAGWNIYVRIPVHPDENHIDTQYPNDYIIASPAHFTLYYPNGSNIDTPLPHRIPQSIIHAIQRLSSHRVIPHINYIFEKTTTPKQQSLGISLPRIDHLSQHALIDRIKRWQRYYPDIPAPGYENIQLF